MTQEEMFEITEYIAEKLKKANNLEDANILKDIKYLKDIEALYLLDSKGFMITDTFLSSHPRLNPAENCLAQKPYFKVCSDLKIDTYITFTYISQATGNLCKTATKKFERAGKIYYLCVDFTVDLTQERKEVMKR